MYYIRLTLKNMKYHFREYLIYFFTLIFSMLFYYGFNDLSFNDNIINNIPEIAILLDYLSKLTYLISIVVIIMLVNISKYIIRTRSKEFAVYTTIGLSQKKIGIMFYLESICVLLLSYMIGILGGSLLAYSLRGMLLKALNIASSNTWHINLSLAGSTLVFYMGIMTLLGVLNYMVLCKKHTTSLMKTAQKNESIVLRNETSRLMIFLVSGFSFVMLGVFFNQYLSNLGQMEASKKAFYEIIMVLLFVLGSYAFFYSFSSLLILSKTHIGARLKWPLYTFFTGEIRSRMFYRSFWYTLIGLLLMMSTVAGTLGQLMAIWAEGNQENVVRYDIELNNLYNDVDQYERNLEVDYKSLIDEIENNYPLETAYGFNLYFVTEDDFYRRKKNNFPPLLMTLESYNTIRSMNQEPHEQLGEGEIIIIFDPSERSQEDIALELETIDFVSQFKRIRYQSEPLGLSTMNNYVGYSIVVENSHIESHKVARSSLMVNLKESIPVERYNALATSIDEWFKDHYAWYYELESRRPAPFRLAIKSQRELASKSAALSVQLTGMVIGYTLLIISCVILSMQVLSESIIAKRKFNTLGKIGATRNDLTRYVYLYCIIEFLGPLLFAFGGFYTFVRFFLKIYGLKYSAYLASSSLTQEGAWQTVGLIIMIYLIYFCLTTYLYKRTTLNKFE